MSKKKQSKSPRTQSNIVISIVGSIVALLILFSVLALTTGYIQFSQTLTQEYSGNALRIANAAALYIDEDALDTYLEKNGEAEEYRVVHELLTLYCDSMDARFIYVIRPTDDYKQIQFIFSTVQTGSGFEPYPIGMVRDTSSTEYMKKYQQLYDGKSTEEIVVRDSPLNATGTHITAMVPLIGSDGKVKGILCVQRQMEALTVGRQRYMLYMGIVTLFLMIVVTFVYHKMLQGIIIRPLRRITGETMRFAEKPTKAEEPLSATIHMDNEIGQLAVSVDKMESETLDYIDNLTRITAESQRIGTELEVASAIQRGMLNSVSPQRREFDILAQMDPAKEVGGDFYDFFMIDGDHLCMAIADVSGKGVPAALFMAISKVILNDSTMISQSPAEILRLMNDRICQHNQQDMFVTVWLGILEISTGRIIAANAGHEYPAIYRSGGRFELFRDKHDFVIGGMDGLRFHEYEITLHRGDSLFVYTDGVAEATDADSQLFGSERMINALNTNSDGTPEEILKAVRTGVDEFVGEAPQFDDLTMMCMKYYGPDGREETQE